MIPMETGLEQSEKSRLSQLLTDSIARAARGLIDALSSDLKLPALYEAQKHLSEALVIASALNPTDSVSMFLRDYEND